MILGEQGNILRELKGNLGIIFRKQGSPDPIWEDLVICVVLILF